MPPFILMAPWMEHLIGTFPGLDTISKLAIGRGTADGGADITFDEATFSTIPRSADWLLASYNNQKPDQIPIPI